MTRRLFAGLIAGLVLAGCYWANPDTAACDGDDDKVWIDHPDVADRVGFWCFDDGDGYPAVYPPVTTAPHYPTVTP